MSPTPTILGTGFAVPNTVRNNDAPIFNWLKEHTPHDMDLFKGYDERRVLGDGEDLMTIMLPAAKSALTDSGLNPDNIDMLLGFASISPYQSPNALSQLHDELGLSERVWTVPLANDFSNFNAGLLMADALVRAGRAKNILIAVGGNWTRFVDYHTPQAISASDGAGAAVLGIAASNDQKPRWQVIDQFTISCTKYYGSMYMQGGRYDPPPGAPALWTDPTFSITQEGVLGFKVFGANAPSLAVNNLLKNNRLSGADITLISHQASSVLMDAWSKDIKPAQYISTLKIYANMTVATLPVTLAWAEASNQINTEWLVLLGIAPDMHTNALLLRRH
jgi:3-oxoacyl-[acyl-carrier-protein] synthase-3